MMESNPIILEDLFNILSAGIDWDKFKNQTILVTGANGFLPAYIVKSLILANERILNNSAKIIGLVRNRSKAEKVFKDILHRTDFEILVQNVIEPIKINGPIGYIIHAASQASPKYYNIDPVGTLSANTIGTYNLLNLGVEKKIKGFLYFSSSEVYGSLPDPSSIKENDFGVSNPTLVRSCYGESKRMGETMCVAYAHQYNLPTTIVRPFHTYGPGLSLDDGRVFADFTANIVRKENITMNSDGKAIRAFCYLTDATVGFFKILLEGKKAESYNMGNPFASASIADLAKTLIEIYPEYGLKLIIDLPDKDYMPSPFNKLCPNIEKIQGLGWHPAVSIKEGFKRTIDSF
jgi:UDP-glucuronate decarboxylase